MSKEAELEEELERVRRENVDLHKRLTAYEPERQPVTAGCWGMTHVFLDYWGEPEVGVRCSCGAMIWGRGV